MILNKILPIYYSTRSNKIFFPPFGLDKPDNGIITSVEWENYPIQNYNYSFNRWAFRGGDYSQFVGKPVNICLGDSFTLNIGGPIEHSWPSQLSKCFDIPTLNFGINGAGNDTIRMIYNWAMEIFEVKNTFVMYSFFHRRHKSNNRTLLPYGQDSLSDSENFKYFENCKIETCYFTFLPRWCWSKTEQDYIHQNYKTNSCSINAKNLDISYLNQNRHEADKKEYDILKGSKWPSYEHFVNGLELSDSMFAEIFVEYVDALFNNSPLFLKNRDGFHLSQVGNSIVCDYFLKQVNRTPFS
jgi:hypothetical protein